tara:strand:+ start:6396 stop:6890 length:495 start_codon:yes stop_codon:yes gene_type:complete
MAKTKIEKLFPTKEQNLKTAEKSMKFHKDLLASGKNISGKTTTALSDNYKNRKRKIRPGAPDNSDFFLSGNFLKSFRVNKKQTTSKSIAYQLGSYLKKDFARGLSSRHNLATEGKYTFAVPGAGENSIPKESFEIFVNDFSNNTKGNISKELKKKKPFKLTVKL